MGGGGIRRVCDGLVSSEVFVGRSFVAYGIQCGLGKVWGRRLMSRRLRYCWCGTSTSVVLPPPQPVCISQPAWVGLLSHSRFHGLRRQVAPTVSCVPVSEQF